MKYLKEYNTYDDKIQELSEYLQEFFDKFCIKSIKGWIFYHPITIPNDGDIHWSMGMEHNENDGYSIKIGWIKQEDMEKIEGYIDDILPHIEKRLGTEISKKISTPNYLSPTSRGYKITLVI